MALAVPFDNPHPDMVDVRETEKETGMSCTWTLATCVHVVPGFDIVTLYDPAVTDDILDALCPLDHAYWYWPGGLTETAAAPSDLPQVDGFVVKDTVGSNGFVPT